MLMKKLPISYPLMETSPITADLLATINMYEDATDWICSNFNQLVYGRKCSRDEKDSFGTMFESQAKENNIIFLELPFMKFNKIKKELVNELTSSFVEFLIKCINNDYYIRVPINYKYLTEMKNEKDYIHTVLIYGYSIIAKKFYIADFHGGKKYGFYEYSFDDVENAYLNSFVLTSVYDEFLEDVIVYKIRTEELGTGIEIDKILKEMTDFINGVDSTCRYENSYRWRDYQFYYGINYFDELIKDIEYGDVKITALHLLCDYFKMLRYKIGVLKDGNYMTEDIYVNLLEQVEMCEKQSLFCRNSYLKYLISCNGEMKNIIIENYRCLKEICKRTIENIVIGVS